MWSDKHASKTGGRLKNHVLPYLGKRQIADIEPMEVLVIIQKIEAKGMTYMSRRVLPLCQSVFRFGKITGHLKRKSQ
ncbi:MAG: phage integrase central domain-containing protein [Roseibacillus sp.]